MDQKSWWEVFKISEFLMEPMKYLPPNIDAWLRAWGNWINLFVQTNPWFCTFLSGTGMTWFTWLVMKTGWAWDDKWPDWIKEKIFKRSTEKPVLNTETKKVIHELVDEIKEDKKS